MKKIIEFSLLLLLLGCFSCVNSVVEDDYRPGTVPISFSAKVTKSAQTRVTDQALESGDKIGLMAIMSGGSLTGQRYIDNLLLTTSTEKVLVPEEVVYYPEGEDAKLDFFAYYPFSQAGVSAGSSQMEVQVQKDQSVKENRSLSDFLVASKSAVASSGKNVELSFKHRLAKIRVELVVDADKVDELLVANPIIKACGFCTQATYDFATGSFSNPTNPAIITLSGTWKKNENVLVGKEMIVVPQTIKSDEHTIALEVNGRIYTCRLTEAELISNSQRVIKISFQEAVDNSLSGLVGNVEDWSAADPEGDETESSYQMTSIGTELLTFTQSNVYHVYYNGKMMAELCKEYLRLPDKGIDAQALVVYPVENAQVNLKQGKVLELLGVTDPVHGGSIKWDVEMNNVEYTAGTQEPIKTIFLDQSGQIVVEKPSNPLPVHVKTYELRDVRGGETRYYGLVKIGTQYWMREELKTDKYTDGKRLSQKQNTEEGACYLKTTDGKYFFYDNQALTDGEMAPEGWKIPKVEDWKLLVDYVGELAALKVGEWQPMGIPDGTTLAPVTNKAMFYGYPIGLWTKNYCNYGKMVGYWSMDEIGTDVAEQTLMLVGSYNDKSQMLINTKRPDTTFYKGLSIRCLRK